MILSKRLLLLFVTKTGQQTYTQISAGTSGYYTYPSSITVHTTSKDGNNNRNMTATAGGATVYCSGYIGDGNGGVDSKYYSLTYYTNGTCTITMRTAPTNKIFSCQTTGQTWTMSGVTSATYSVNGTYHSGTPAVWEWR